LRATWAPAVMESNDKIVAYSTFFISVA